MFACACVINYITTDPASVTSGMMSGPTSPTTSSSIVLLPSSSSSYSLLSSTISLQLTTMPLSPTSSWLNHIINITCVINSVCMYTVQ